MATLPRWCPGGTGAAAEVFFLGRGSLPLAWAIFPPLEGERLLLNSQKKHRRCCRQLRTLNHTSAFEKWWCDPGCALRLANLCSSHSCPPPSSLLTEEAEDDMITNTNPKPRRSLVSLPADTRTLFYVYRYADRCPRRFVAATRLHAALSCSSAHTSVRVGWSFFPLCVPRQRK